MCERRATCKQNCINDYYPHTTCADSTTYTVTYEGHTYNKLFYYPISSSSTSLYSVCVKYAQENSEVETVPLKSRQARVHTCFPYCLSTSSFASTCVSVGLLCVSPDDICEYTVQPGEIVIYEESNGKNSIAFSPLVGIYAILVVLPMHLLFDIACIIVMKCKGSDQDSFWVVLRNKGFQVILAAIVSFSLAGAIYCLLYIHLDGRPWPFWLTFIFAFIVDQAKSVAVLAGLWYFLIRRCGFLQPNEFKALINTNKFSIPIVAQLQNLFLQNIETPWFSALTRYMLGFYSGFALFWMSTEDIISMDYTCKIIDIVFLVIFAAELGVRLFGLGLTYLLNFWNFFDASIIVVSLILYGMNTGTQALAVMRLIRILVIIVVKFTGTQFTIKLHRDDEDPVQALLALLNNLIQELVIVK